MKTVLKYITLPFVGVNRISGWLSDKAEAFVSTPVLVIIWMIFFFGTYGMYVHETVIDYILLGGLTFVYAIIVFFVLSMAINIVPRILEFFTRPFISLYNFAGGSSRSKTNILSDYEIEKMLKEEVETSCCRVLYPCIWSRNIPCHRNGRGI